MKTPSTEEIWKTFEDVAELLPAQSRTAFLAACQNLQGLPLVALRDLTTVFVGSTWAITQRGGLNALPEIARKMDKAINAAVQKAMKHSVDRAIREAVKEFYGTPAIPAFSPVPDSVMSAIHLRQDDPLYREIVARLRMACHAEIGSALKRALHERGETRHLQHPKSVARFPHWSLATLAAAMMTMITLAAFAFMVTRTSWPTEKMAAIATLFEVEDAEIYVQRNEAWVSVPSSAISIRKDKDRTFVNLKLQDRGILEMRQHLEAYSKDKTPPK